MLKIAKYLILLVGLARSAYFDSLKKQISNKSTGMLLCIRGVLLLLEILLCQYGWKEELMQALLGFFIIGSMFFVFYFWVEKSIGAGDVKLLAVMGAYLGYEQTLWSVLIACLYVAATNDRKKKEIPFAPYIFCGTVIVLIFEWMVH